MHCVLSDVTFHRSSEEYTNTHLLEQSQNAVRSLKALSTDIVQKFSTYRLRRGLLGILEKKHFIFEKNGILFISPHIVLETFICTKAKCFKYSAIRKLRSLHFKGHVIHCYMCVCHVLLKSYLLTYLLMQQTFVRGFQSNTKYTACLSSIFGNT